MGLHIQSNVNLENSQYVTMFNSDIQSQAEPTLNIFCLIHPDITPQHALVMLVQTVTRMAW